MKEAKLSIIVPVYNGEKYIDRCAESLINQTYKNLEIIFIDDGSKDNSLKICENWQNKDKRIKVYHKENGGVSSARNLGIEKSSGEFIKFVDCDDYITQDFCYNNMKVFDNETDLVVSGMSFLDKNKKSKLSKNSGEITDILIDIDKFLQFISDEFFDITVNKVYRKSLITKLFMLNQPLSEDRIFNLDYFDNITKKIIFVDDAGYVYDRTNSESACHKVRGDAYIFWLRAIHYTKDFLLKKFNTYNNKIFLQQYCGTVFLCIAKCGKSHRTSLLNQIKDDEFHNFFLKNYKPKTLKNKLKFFLIKHNCFKLSKFILKVLGHI